MVSTRSGPKGNPPPHQPPKRNGKKTASDAPARKPAPRQRKAREEPDLEDVPEEDEEDEEEEEVIRAPTRRKNTGKGKGEGKGKERRNAAVEDGEEPEPEEELQDVQAPRGGKEKGKANQNADAGASIPSTRGDDDVPAQPANGGNGAKPQGNQLPSVAKETEQPGQASPKRKRTSSGGQSADGGARHLPMDEDGDRQRTSKRNKTNDAPANANGDRPPSRQADAGASNPGKQRPRMGANTPNRHQPHSGDKRPLSPGARYLNSVIEDNEAPASLQSFVLRALEQAGDTPIGEIVQALVEFHGPDADFLTKARHMRDYIGDRSLVHEAWTEASEDGSQGRGENSSPRSQIGSNTVPLPPALSDEEVLASARTPAESLARLWRSADISPACRNYIRNALDGDPANLAKRVLLLDAVVRAHNKANDELWIDAPPIERYLTSRFREDENWPLNEENLNAAWTEALGALYRNNTIPRSALVDRLKMRRQLAKRLFRHHGVFLGPTPRGANDTNDTYVNGKLGTNFPLDAMALIKPLWDVHIDASPTEEQKERIRREFADMQNSDRLPWTYEEAEWRRRWDRIEGAANATPRLLPRIRDIRRVAEDTLVHGLEFLEPIDLDEDSISEGYVDRLWTDVRDKRATILTEAWQAAADSDPDLFDEQTEVIDTRLPRGDPIWWPGEEEVNHENDPRSLFERLGSGGDRTRDARTRGHWNWTYALGKGGYGSASLLVKYDAQMAILDRIVVKDVFMGESWTSNWPWYTGNGYKQPIEEFIPKMLKRARDSDHILHCLGSGIYDVLQLVRIYTEFCPHGNLRDLIKSHERLGELVDEHGNRPESRIPLRAIWAIFEALVAAVHLMQHNSIPPVPPPMPGLPVLHNDIKDVNVFLAAPDAGQLWPGIPVPKLGDFGIARLYNVQDTPMNIKVGTPGWMAPEQAGPTGRKVSFASDVWAIGLIMLCLVNLTHRTVRFDMNWEDKYFPPPFEPTAIEYYPQSLLDLIHGCLQKDAAQRIRIKDLWDRVRQHVAQMPDYRAAPMKLQPQPEGEVRLGYKPDRFFSWADNVRAAANHEPPAPREGS